MDGRWVERLLETRAATTLAVLAMLLTACTGSDSGAAPSNTSTISNGSTIAIDAPTDAEPLLAKPGAPSGYRFVVSQVLLLQGTEAPGGPTGFTATGVFEAPERFDYEVATLGTVPGETTRYVLSGFSMYKLEPGRPWRSVSDGAPVGAAPAKYGAVPLTMSVDDLYDVLTYRNDWEDVRYAGTGARAYTLTDEDVEAVINLSYYEGRTYSSSTEAVEAVFYFDDVTQHLVGYDVNLTLSPGDDDERSPGATRKLTLTAAYTALDDARPPIEIPNVIPSDAPGGYSWYEVPDLGLRFLHKAWWESSRPTGFLELPRAELTAFFRGRESVFALYAIPDDSSEASETIDTLAADLILALSAIPGSEHEFEGAEFANGIDAIRFERELDRYTEVSYVFENGSDLYAAVFVIDAAFSPDDITDIDAILESIEFFDPVTGAST